MPGTERRKFLRVIFDAPATLTTPSGDKLPTTLLDLSLKGVLLKTVEGFTNEEGNYSLQIELDENTSISMSLSLSHTEKDSIGLTCEQIDLDSMTHLRRLVELNMGNADLLDRELNELAS